MSIRSEKPQRGNLGLLALRQHVFPRKSIDRFVEYGVDLFDIGRRRHRRAAPDDAMICTKRAWNHGAETGWTKVIDDSGVILYRMISMLFGCGGRI